MNKQKHILVICQYFYPEPFRINDICTEWVRRGYKVTVLTGIPNYPQGKFYDGYGLNKKRRESWNGIDIIRIPLIARGHNPIQLVLNYFSFPVSGWFWNRFSNLKADYVFMFETSPMNQCKIGLGYKKKHKVPLYLYMQDLWPENVEIMTGVHNKLVIGGIQRMVDKIYRGCDHIFTTSESYVEAVKKRGIPAERVHYWPQYGEEFYRPAKRTAVEEIPMDDKFKIIFTGNIGFAQGMDILPKTAEYLKSRGVKDVNFVVVGDGRYRQQMEQDIDSVREMFTMVPRQPAERIPSLLAACDAAFFSFQDNELWKMVIPAKLQSYMACGMPVIASAEGESEKIVKEAHCGVCTPLGDYQALGDAIIRMKNADLSEMRQNSLDYFARHFEKKMLMDWFDEFLK